MSCRHRIQITNDLFLKGLYMFVFDLPTDKGACNSHTSVPDKKKSPYNLNLTKHFWRPWWLYFGIWTYAVYYLSNELLSLIYGDR
jgi:hypothetical protein